MSWKTPVLTQFINIIYKCEINVQRLLLKNLCFRLWMMDTLDLSWISHMPSPYSWHGSPWGKPERRWQKTEKEWMTLSEIPCISHTSRTPFSLPPDRLHPLDLSKDNWEIETGLAALSFSKQRFYCFNFWLDHNFQEAIFKIGQGNGRHKLNKEEVPRSSWS